MKILQLSPIEANKTHRYWGRGYKGNVIVRAKDEGSAREQVARRFFEMIKREKQGEPTPHSPWQSGDFVACEEISGDEKWDANGEEAILYPN